MYVTTRTAGIYLDAARQLEKRGWAQGTGMTPDGRLCLVGAISMGFRVDRTLDIRAFNAATDGLRGLLGMAPHRWNDMPGRTREEVVDALRRAASRHVTVCFR